jgi:hypothetical protein
VYIFAKLQDGAFAHGGKKVLCFRVFFQITGIAKPMALFNTLKKITILLVSTYFVMYLM